MGPRLCQAKHMAGRGKGCHYCLWVFQAIYEAGGLYPKWAVWSVLLHLGPFQASVV